VTDARFGGIGLIDGGRRSASAEALEDTDLLALPRSDFLRLLADEPKLVQGVLRECGRLIRVDGRRIIIIDMPGLRGRAGLAAPVHSR